MCNEQQSRDISQSDFPCTQSCGDIWWWHFVVSTDCINSLLIGSSDPSFLHATHLAYVLLHPLTNLSGQVPVTCHTSALAVLRVFEYQTHKGLRLLTLNNCRNCFSKFKAELERSIWIWCGFLVTEHSCFITPVLYFWMRRRNSQKASRQNGCLELKILYARSRDILWRLLFHAVAGF